MHLHPGRDADDRDLVPNHVQHISGRAVPPAKNDQVDPPVEEGLTCPARVLRPAFPLDLKDHLMLLPEGREDGSAHLPRGREEAYVPLYHRQGPGGFSLRHRNRSPGHRLSIRIPVGAFQRHASAHPGDGVHNETKEHATETFTIDIRPLRTGMIVCYQLTS